MVVFFLHECLTFVISSEVYFFLINALDCNLMISDLWSLIFEKINHRLLFLNDNNCHLSFDESDYFLSLCLLLSHHSFYVTVLRQSEIARKIPISLMVDVTAFTTSNHIPAEFNHFSSASSSSSPSVSWNQWKRLSILKIPHARSLISWSNQKNGIFRGFYQIWTRCLFSIYRSRPPWTASAPARTFSASSSRTTRWSRFAPTRGPSWRKTPAERWRKSSPALRTTSTPPPRSDRWGKRWR